MDELPQDLAPATEQKELSLWQKIKRLYVGRMGRKHLAIAIAYFVLAIFIFSFALVLISELLPEPIIGPFTYAAIILIGIVAFGSSLSLHIRRLHDIGLSAIWLIPYFIIGYGAEFIGNDVAEFIVGILVLVSALLYLFYPGTTGPNKFGPSTSMLPFLDALFNRTSAITELDNTIPKKIYRLKYQYVKAYFIIAIGCIGALTYTFHYYTINSLLTSPYEEAPEMYQFIMFPTYAEVEVYKDKELTEKLGTANRAFMVDGQELKDGIVATDFATNGECKIGYMNIEDLTFNIPSNYAPLVEKTNELYRACAEDSSKMSIVLTDTEDQATRVEYTFLSTTLMTDDTTDVYSYTTKNGALTGVGSSQSFGALKHFATFAFDILLFLFLLGLSWLLSFIIFQRRADNEAHWTQTEVFGLNRKKQLFIITGIILAPILLYIYVCYHSDIFPQDVNPQLLNGSVDLNKIDAEDAVPYVTENEYSKFEYSTDELKALEAYDTSLGTTCEDAQKNLVQEKVPEDFFQACVQTKIWNDMMSESDETRSLAQQEQYAIYGNQAQFMTDDELTASLKAKLKTLTGDYDTTTGLEASAQHTEFYQRGLKDQQIESSLALILEKQGPCWGIPEGQCRE